MGEDDTTQRQRQRKNREEMRAVPRDTQILPEEVWSRADWLQGGTSPKLR